jgi:glycosyltransferase involved in cell wall biosynthesis
MEIPRSMISLALRSLRVRLRSVLSEAHLVHAHGTRAGAAVSLSLRNSEIPVLVTVHNAAFTDSLGGRVSTFASDQLLARYAKKRIYVSEDMARRARRSRPERAGDVLTIPAGALLEDVSEEQSASASQRLEALAARPFIFCAGRLHPQKGFDILVKAASGLDPAASIFIAGEGPARKGLEALINQLGMTERVFLLGRRDDVGALISAADVVCMPSRWEGSPLALHEALHLGKPVVASAVGGIVDMIEDGVSGVLVPSEDAVALADALSRVLGDEALRLSLTEGAKKAAAKWPDARATAARIADVYAEVLSGS